MDIDINDNTENCYNNYNGYNTINNINNINNNDEDIEMNNIFPKNNKCIYGINNSPFFKKK